MYSFSILYMEAGTFCGKWKVLKFIPSLDRMDVALQFWKKMEKYVASRYVKSYRIFRELL